MILLVDRLVVERDRGDRRGHGDLAAGDLLGREQAALQILWKRGRDLVAVHGDELDADFVERERVIRIIGDDDADGQEAMLDVGQAKKWAALRLVAGIRGDGHLLRPVRVKGGVLVGWLHRRRLTLFFGASPPYGEKRGDEKQPERARDKFGPWGHAEEKDVLRSR